MIQIRPDISVAIQRTSEADPGIALPEYATRNSAGMDLRANFSPDNRSDGISLGPNERALIPTGFKLEIPEGFEVQIRPRSGLALKFGVTLVNSPGTIDADYRGEIGVILINHGADRIKIGHGDRIAQMVLAPVMRAHLEETGKLGNTARGAGGFGSTGL